MARSQGWRTLAALCASVLMMMYGTPAAAGDGPAAKRPFQIEAGDADTRLGDFSIQSGVQVLYIYETVKDSNTRSVQGKMRPIEALARMLEGTGVKYEFINKGTVTLTPPTAAGPRLTPPLSGRSRDIRRKIDRRAPSSEIAQVTVEGVQPPPPPPIGGPRISLDRVDIEATNSVTVSSLVRTLPQVFGGGPTEDTPNLGQEARTNSGRGSGMNLRGLGAGSTLVLLNGHRLPGGGSEGLFVDVSNLPLAAVERIDILPDSSSTLFGGDAVSGAVNFVMRDKFDGQRTDAYFGAATEGALNEEYFSQIVGRESDTRHWLLAIDFHSRDNLPAADRAQARSDLRAFGGYNFDTPLSSPGNIMVGEQMWAIPRGQDGTRLEPSDLIPDAPNLRDLRDHSDLLPSQQRWSAFGTGRQEIGEHTALFVDALMAQRDMKGTAPATSSLLQVPDSNPFHVSPTGAAGTVVVAYNFRDDLGPQVVDARVKLADFAMGLDWQPHDRFTMTTTAAYAAERQRVVIRNQVNLPALFSALADPNPATAFNPFGDGSHTNPATIETLRSQSLFVSRSDVKSLNALTRWDMMELGGGPMKLTTGTNHRLQDFASDSTSPPIPISNNLRRSVFAGFAELQLPFIGEANRKPWAQLLELSIAGRYENYSDFGHTTVPRYGFAWAPFEGVKLRGTWSESFRPPGLVDLNEGLNSYAYIALPDPTAPGGRATTLVWSGKNTSLRQEHATSWTAGLDLEWARVPGLSIATTYFDIDFRDRMSQPELPMDLLTNPRFADFVLRNPSAAERAFVCSHAPIATFPMPCDGVPVSAIADMRIRNDSSVQTSGFDFIAKLVRPTEWGKLTLGLNGTYILSFSEAATHDQPREEHVSTQSSPVDLRLRGSLGWQRGGLSANLHVNYVDNYRDTFSTPQRRVRSWTTYDVNVAYEIPANDAAWLGATTFALGGDNILNRSPPFLNNRFGIGYDEENADLLGRFLSFTIRKSW